MLWTGDECYGQMMSSMDRWRVLWADDESYGQMMSAMDR